MGGYADFAAFYDRLTDDVGYPQRADYIAELLMEHGMKKGIVLDLACGTGSLTLELSKRGYEMIGVDASPDMLCAAQEKCAQAGAFSLPADGGARSLWHSECRCLHARQPQSYH